MTFDDALDAAATGDVWLFRGASVADRAIRTFTNAPVNHVGMVVALDDLPPLLWHAELVGPCRTCGPASITGVCSSTSSPTPLPSGARSTASEPGCASSMDPSSATTRTA